MALTATQITQLNNSNEAHQRAGIGTLLGEIKDGASLGAMNKIEATVAFGDFTGATTTGTYELSEDIPIGAVVYMAVLQPALVGFAGDTSAVITVGDGTDVDRYNTGTPDVFSDVAGGIGLGVPAGTQYHAAAKTPTIIITTAAAWSSVTAGSLTIAIYYFV